MRAGRVRSGVRAGAAIAATGIVVVAGLVGHAVLWGSATDDRIVWTVETRVPVSAAPGTWPWPVDGYGRPVIAEQDGPSTAPAMPATPHSNPPLSYYDIAMRIDLTVDSIVPVLAGAAEPGRAAPPPPVGTIPTPPTFDPAVVTAGEAALRSDPAVAAAIGMDFEVIRPEILGTVDHPNGIGFLVKTPRPVTMPTGTPVTKPTGERGPVVIEPSPSPIGPLTYFLVSMDEHMVPYLFLGIPDEFGIRWEAEAEAEAAASITGAG